MPRLTTSRSTLTRKAPAPPAAEPPPPSPPPLLQPPPSGPDSTDTSDAKIAPLVMQPTVAETPTTTLTTLEQRHLSEAYFRFVSEHSAVTSPSLLIELLLETNIFVSDANVRSLFDRFADHPRLRARAVGGRPTRLGPAAHSPMRKASGTGGFQLERIAPMLSCGGFLRVCDAIKQDFAHEQVGGAAGGGEGGRDHRAAQELFAALQGVGPPPISILKPNEAQALRHWQHMKSKPQYADILKGGGGAPTQAPSALARLDLGDAEVDPELRQDILMLFYLHKDSHSDRLQQRRMTVDNLALVEENLLSLPPAARAIEVEVLVAFYDFAARVEEELERQSGTMPHVEGSDRDSSDAPLTGSSTHVSMFAVKQVLCDFGLLRDGRSSPTAAAKEDGKVGHVEPSMYVQISKDELDKVVGLGRGVDPQADSHAPSASSGSLGTTQRTMAVAATTAATAHGVRFDLGPLDDESDEDAQSVDVELVDEEAVERDFILTMLAQADDPDAREAAVAAAAALDREVNPTTERLVTLLQRSNRAAGLPVPTSLAAAAGVGSVGSLLSSSEDGAFRSADRTSMGGDHVELESMNACASAAFNQTTASTDTAAGENAECKDGDNADSSLSGMEDGARASLLRHLRSTRQQRGSIWRGERKGPGGPSGLLHARSGLGAASSCASSSIAVDEPSVVAPIMRRLRSLQPVSNHALVQEQRRRLRRAAKREAAAGGGTGGGVTRNAKFGMEVAIQAAQLEYERAFAACEMAYHKFLYLPQLESRPDSTPIFVRKSFAPVPQRMEPILRPGEDAGVTRDSECGNSALPVDGKSRRKARHHHSFLRCLGEADRAAYFSTPQWASRLHSDAEKSWSKVAALRQVPLPSPPRRQACDVPSAHLSPISASKRDGSSSACTVSNHVQRTEVELGDSLGPWCSGAAPKSGPLRGAAQQQHTRAHSRTSAEVSLLTRASRARRTDCTWGRRAGGGDTLPAAVAGSTPEAANPSPAARNKLARLSIRAVRMLQQQTAMNMNADPVARKADVKSVGPFRELISGIVDPRLRALVVPSEQMSLVEPQSGESPQRV